MAELFNHRLDQEIDYYYGKFSKPSDRRRTIKNMKTTIEGDSKPKKLIVEVSFVDEIDLE